MFKYCVWFKLKDNHIINRQIKQYAKVFNTHSFPAHITLRHSMVYEEAMSYKYMIPPSYEPIGAPVMTCTEIDNKRFYAIEQPLTMNAHVSLAYRFAPFTPAELSVVSRITRIFGQDLEICVADCSKSIDKWSVVYKMVKPK